MNILIAEDNPNDRRLLRYTFEHHGWNVIEAENGTEGLELAAAHRPDIIVSDALMPVMDGFQLLRALKSDPELRSIPFIFYSATYTGQDEAELALSLGAEAFLLKPKEPEELWRETCKIHGEWKARQEVPAHAAIEENEQQFLREYSHIVATKLEKKVLELEEVLKQRSLAEEEVRRLNEELEERVQVRTAELEQKTRELEDSNRELETFSYSISHDMKAPLRHIDGFSEALQEEYGRDLPPNGQHYLNRIRKACCQTQRLIDDLLTFSRLIRAPLKREQICLSDMAAEIIGELRQAEPSRQMETVIAKGIRVNGDATLLRTVMENLLGNAWKYTGKRGKALIEFSAEERDGRPVYCVRDNGAGFDMAYSDKLFGVFQRLHTSEEFEGTGVGLATCQRIIRRHGGDIWAEGEKDKGAAFYFTL